MLRRVAHVIPDVSEELSAPFIRVARIGELGTTLAVTSNRRTRRTRATQRNIPEDTILHSDRRENLRSYIVKHYAMKSCGVTAVYIQVSFTSALFGCEWSASCPGRVIFCERIAGTHWMGGWMVPTVGLYEMKKGEFLTLPGQELRTPPSSTQ
jgi:hypothetical protein